MPNKTTYITLGVLAYAIVFIFFLNSLDDLTTLFVMLTTMSTPVVLSFMYFFRKYVFTKSLDGIFWKMILVGVLSSFVGPIVVIAMCDAGIGSYRFGLCLAAFTKGHGGDIILFLLLAPIIGLISGIILAKNISSRNRNA